MHMPFIANIIGFYGDPCLNNVTRANIKRKKKIHKTINSRILRKCNNYRRRTVVFYFFCWCDKKRGTIGMIRNCTDIYLP